MNRLLLLLAFLAPTALLARQPLQPEQKLTSVITHVRVYLDQAGITEEAALMLQPGLHQLVFSQLPEAMVEGSVMVTGVGTGVIQSVTTRLTYLDQSVANPRLKRLQDSTATVRLVLQRINNKLAVLNKQLELLEVNQDLSGEGSEGIKVDDLIKLTEYYQTKLTQIREQKLVLGQERQVVEETLDRLKAQLKEMQDSRQRPTREVLVVYRANVAEQLQLKLQYLVQNAGWTPVYDLRITDATKPVLLNLKADIINNTGQDWKQVKLTLSSANPAKGGNPPAFKQRYAVRKDEGNALEGRAAGVVIRMEPTDAQLNEIVVMGYGGRDGDDFSDGSEDEEEEEEVPAPAQAVTAASFISATNTLVNVEYNISLPYDIPADGKPRQVDVRQTEAPALFNYYCQPSADKDAFLQAQLVGWDQLNLLPGKANVYYGGSYLAATELNITTGDTLSIGLGREARIQVQQDNQRNTKTSGSQVREIHTQTLNLRNSRPDAVELIVVEAIPTPTSSLIQLNLNENHGGEYQPEKGKLVWRVKLVPGESRRLQFTYELKYPKAIQVQVK